MSVVGRVLAGQPIHDVLNALLARLSQLAVGFVYFQGPEREKANSDCVQVVIALVVTPEGFRSTGVAVPAESKRI